MLLIPTTVALGDPTLFQVFPGGIEAADLVWQQPMISRGRFEKRVIQVIPFESA